MQNGSATGNIFIILILTCVVFIFYLILSEGNVRNNGDDNGVQVSKRSGSRQQGRTTIEDMDDDSRELLLHTLKHYPHFPTQFYEHKAKTLPKSINKSCAIFPTLEKITFSNVYWQTLHIASEEYQLLGAYWDVRTNYKNNPTVRILVMITPITITENLYCQFWFKKKVILSEKVYSYFLWRENWGGYREGQYKPYLLNCKVPAEYIHNPPIAVSLVTNPCDQASNILKIYFNNPSQREDFAVCVKGLDFHDDISIRLIEWIEMLKLLGAQKIFFYHLHVHEDVQKILDYYEEEEGRVELTPVTLPGRYPNEPYLQHLFLSVYQEKKRLYELMSYNDCFLKHMYEYEYIVLLDIDEIILPSVGDWAMLMQNITSNPANMEKSSYNARNVYYFDDFMLEGEYIQGIPPYMHMLQHVFRMEEVMESGLYVKSFYSTDLVLALHNHYPLYCLDSCSDMEIDPEWAKLQHYRKDCVREIKDCD